MSEKTKHSVVVIGSLTPILRRSCVIACRSAKINPGKIVVINKYNAVVLDVDMFAHTPELYVRVSKNAKYNNVHKHVTWSVVPELMQANWAWRRFHFG